MVTIGMKFTVTMTVTTMEDICAQVFARISKIVSKKAFVHVHAKHGGMCI
jgi:hypothetical protein